MSSHSPRRIAGLSIIQTMTLLAILGVVLFAALSLFKKESAPQVSFRTLNGEQVAMDSLRGKVVMVNFWATSCSTCVQEMPQMVETYKKYSDQGLEFIAVAMSYDPPNYVPADQHGKSCAPWRRRQHAQIPSQSPSLRTSQIHQDARNGVLANDHHSA